MICPNCKQRLVIEQITHETAIRTRQLIGVGKLGDLIYKASRNIESLQQHIVYFRCSKCFNDLKLTENQVIDLIKNNPLEYMSPISD